MLNPRLFIKTNTQKHAVVENYRFGVCGYDTSPLFPYWVQSPWHSTTKNWAFVLSPNCQRLNWFSNELPLIRLCCFKMSFEVYYNWLSPIGDIFLSKEIRVVWEIYTYLLPILTHWLCLTLHTHYHLYSPNNNVNLVLPIGNWGSWKSSNLQKISC